MTEKLIRRKKVNLAFQNSGPKTCGKCGKYHPNFTLLLLIKYVENVLKKLIQLKVVKRMIVFLIKIIILMLMKMLIQNSLQVP